MQVKGKGEMQTYLVVGKETGSPAGVQRQPSSRSSLAAVVYGMVRARRRHTTSVKGTHSLINLFTYELFTEGFD